MKRLSLLYVFLSLLFVSYQNQIAGVPHFLLEGDEVVSKLEAVSADESKVKLSWQVDNAEEGLYFLLQRSFDGVEYQTLGGLRHSSSKSYAFFDLMAEKNKKVFYRLKLIKESDPERPFYSSEISFTHQWDSQLYSYSSPGRDKLFISVPPEVKDQFSLTVVSYTGQVVMSASMNASYNRKLPIATDGFKRGTYFIQLTSGNHRWTTKLLRN